MLIFEICRGQARFYRPYCLMRASDAEPTRGGLGRGQCGPIARHKFTGSLADRVSVEGDMPQGLTINVIRRDPADNPHLKRDPRANPPGEGETPAA